MTHARRWPLLALLSLALWLPAAWAQAPIPALSARVTDTTGTLTLDQRQALEQTLAEFERRKGAQLALLMVPTTGEETIEQYGIRVAEAWKLGRKGTDDGLILIAAKDDRTLRIEVGYGLEGVIPDAIANRVIDEIIVPRFRQGDFYGGVRAGLERLMSLIEGEPLPPPRAQPAPGGGGAQLLPLAFFGYFILSGILGRMLGRLPGAAVTGGVVGGLFWLMAGSLAMALLVGVAAFVFALGGIGVGRFGGFGGGRMGGLGGGGVFRGGGGGFGGGGASGRW